MNKGLSLIMFTMGALAGSFGSMRYFKKKYEQLAQEEIESVKESFRKKHESIVTTTPAVVKVSEPETPAKSTEDQTMYTSTLHRLGYVEEQPKVDVHTIIAPEELGDIDGYKVFSLTYFADGILADDAGTIFDIELSIGSESLKHFGEYEDDAIHVRNTSLENDYEVLLDVRKYSEVYPDLN